MYSSSKVIRSSAMQGYITDQASTRVSIPGRTSLERWLSIDSEDGNTFEGDFPDAATIEVVTAIRFVDTPATPAATPVLLHWPIMQAATDDIAVIRECPLTYRTHHPPHAHESHSKAFHLPTKICGALKHRRTKSKASVSVQKITTASEIHGAGPADLTAFHATVRLLREEALLNNQSAVSSAR